MGGSGVLRRGCGGGGRLGQLLRSLQMHGRRSIIVQLPEFGEAGALNFELVPYAALSSSGIPFAAQMFGTTGCDLEGFKSC